MAVVGASSVGSLKSDVQSLGSGADRRAATAAADIESNMQDMGHQVAQHLYVYDGMLGDQDRIAKEVDRLEADVRTDLGALGTLVHTPAGRQAVERAVAMNGRLQTGVAHDQDVAPGDGRRRRGARRLARAVRRAGRAADAEGRGRVRGRAERGRRPDGREGGRGGGQRVRGHPADRDRGAARGVAGRRAGVAGHAVGHAPGRARGPAAARAGRRWTA
jgi:hypothetical protein